MSLITINVMCDKHLLGEIMATLVDVNASLDVLNVEVARVAQEVADLKAQGTPAATEADLDAVKSRVDSAKDALAAL